MTGIAHIVAGMTETTKILVTGATGLVGRHVVDQLLAAGVTVRALTRNPAAAKLPAEVEVVQGDLTEPGSVRPALAGVDRIYVKTNMLPIWAPSIRAERVVRYPFADQVGVPIHEQDVAAVAVAALLEDRHVGAIYTLSGPAQVTYREQVAAIGEALGEAVRYEEVTREQARDLLKAQGGIAATNADLLLGFVDYGGGDASGSSEEDYSALLQPWPGVQDATGRPARTFAEWARDHVQDFR